jgi:uncharacterized repeat protein (TIGR02543 family)
MHAQWQAGAPTQYTLAFNTHGGSAVAAITRNEGTQVSKPADPTRSGYSFTGWFSAETGGTAYTAWPYTLTGNITMHAQWVIAYTVTFHSAGGSPAPGPQFVATGETASQPGPMTKAAPEGLYTGTVDLDTLVTFDGWYNAAYTTKYTFTAPVTGNLDLYAKWTGPSSVDLSGEPGNTVLEKSLSYIGKQTLAQTTNYTVALAENYSLPGINSDSNPNINTANAVITLAGAIPAEISLSSNGYLFHINAGKLILDKNITLKGIDSNDKSLVHVYGSSTSLVMKAGAKITGNTTSGYGGGVYVLYGDFTMEGGEISNNTASSIRGSVSVRDGSFTMKGGEISNNTGNGVYVSGSGSSFIMEGGEITGNSSRGVVVDIGSFTMEGGEISNNTSGVVVTGSFTMKDGVISNNTAGESIAYGGGVLVSSGSFTMEGGEISGNSAPLYGGGVYVSGANGSFTMEKGIITGNSAESGGGVYVSGSSSSFTMEDGIISNNTATTYSGGGVCVVSSSFTMKGGEISDNTATVYYGGGVCVIGDGSAFAMQNDAKITGNSALRGGGVYLTGSDNSSAFTMQNSAKITGNSATSGGGVFVYANGSFTMKGGTISSNSASPAAGGGVIVTGIDGSDNGSFTMEGGEISGNSTATVGGGVYADLRGNFSKTGGGVIYGDTDGTPYPDNGNATDNTAKNGNTNGHAVYYNYFSSIYYRDTTLNTGDNISAGDTLPANSGDSLNNWTKK